MMNAAQRREDWLAKAAACRAAAEAPGCSAENRLENLTAMAGYEACAGIKTQLVVLPSMQWIRLYEFDLLPLYPSSHFVPAYGSTIGKHCDQATLFWRPETEAERRWVEQDVSTRVRQGGRVVTIDPGVLPSTYWHRWVSQ